MPLRNIARIVVAFGEALGKAFSRAVHEEMSASRQAAQRQAHQATSSSSASTRFGAEQEAMRANAKLGISLQESMQILDVRQPLAVEEVEKRYKHLFEINDKSKGGTLYLQSKVYRAKQRLDEELARIARSEEEKKAKQRQYEQESGSRAGG